MFISSQQDVGDEMIRTSNARMCILFNLYQKIIVEVPQTALNPFESSEGYENMRFANQLMQNAYSKWNSSFLSKMLLFEKPFRVLSSGLNNGVYLAWGSNNKGEKNSLLDCVNVELNLLDPCFKIYFTGYDVVSGYVKSSFLSSTYPPAYRYKCIYFGPHENFLLVFPLYICSEDEGLIPPNSVINTNPGGKNLISVVGTVQKDGEKFKLPHNPGVFLNKHNLKRRNYFYLVDQSRNSTPLILSRQSHVLVELYQA